MRRTRRAAVAVAAMVAATLSGAAVSTATPGSASAAPAAGAAAAPAAAAPAAAAPAAAAPAAAAPAAAKASGTLCGTRSDAPDRFEHVVLIIFENKSQDQIFTGTSAPYFQSLAAACGRGTNMNAVEPIASLPNYIALTSGYTGSPKPITYNRGPNVWPQDSVSIFEQLRSDWREWSENMPSPCFTKQAYDFTVNHTPAPYYTRIADTCRRNDLPMPSTPDISSAFTLLTPNKAHIMHEDDAPGKTSKAQRMVAGDTWLAEYLPKVFAQPEYQDGSTVVIITFDEGTSRDNHVPFLVMSPYTAAGYTTNEMFTHYSTLKGMQQMLGLSPLLGHAGDPGVASIRDFFGLS